MSDVLYVQTEKNVEVHQPEVYLQDVAKLSSSSTSVLNRNRVRKVFTVPDGKPGRYVYLPWSWWRRSRIRNRVWM